MYSNYELMRVIVIWGIYGKEDLRTKNNWHWLNMPDSYMNFTFAVKLYH